MSRIGKKPIIIPAGAEVKVEGNRVFVKGPKGNLEREFDFGLTIASDDGIVTVTRPNDEQKFRALHGLTRTLISNMVQGVTVGYSKELEINGVGYRAMMQGTQLVMNLGYSHQVIYKPADGIKIEVAGQQNKIIVSGINKELVGQTAAEIRIKRPPEPYLGKGIKYSTEVIRRKEGKAGKGGKGGKK